MFISRIDQKYMKFTCIYFFFLLVIFFISFFLRYPKINESFINSDATYHVLMTMQTYEENKVSVHKFLPIQTYKEQSNKFINNGPSLLMDKSGNSYYLSFSPLGFVAPYLFCKIFNLSLTDTSLYYFNSFIMLISGLLCGLICLSLVSEIYNLKYILFSMVFLLYIFQPEVMKSQGIVYWHQSLTQLFLLAGILLFIKDINKKLAGGGKNKYYILLCIISFLYPYTEWTGYVFNIGLVICYIIASRRNISCKISYLKKAFFIILLTILAIFVYYSHFSLNVDKNVILQTLFGRYQYRSSGGIIKLLFSYWQSYSILITIDLLLLCVVMCIKKYRIEFFRYFESLNHNLITIAIFFPVLENFIMLEHAVWYTFDRLKVCLVLLYIFTIFIYSIRSLFKQYFVLLGILSVAFVLFFNSYLYIVNGNNHIQLKYMQETFMLKDYITKKYNYNDIILNKEGWRAWGWLQSLYHRNFFCSAIYNSDELINEALKRGASKVITLFPYEAPDDKSTYIKANIYNIIDNSNQILTADKNGVSVSSGMIVRCSNLTDQNWVNGILKTDHHIMLFPYDKVIYSALILHNSFKVSNKVYNIVNITKDNNWISVQIDSDAINCAYPAEIIIN